jgi:tRNA pseudouridine38-40 synthase
MRWLKLTLAYDGTSFAGWQRQRDRLSVEEALERAIEQATGERTELVASGRTDAGVHALGQAVSFTTNSRLGADILQRAINARLPEEIVVVSAEEVPEGFDARRHAVGKRYRYQIHNARLRPLLDRRYVWHVRQPLDAPAMERAAQGLVGKHDFSSFQAVGSPREHTVRTVRRIDVSVEPLACGRRIVIGVEGDGFLYRMVRTIVGTLVEVGRGARQESWPTEVLRAADRRRAGPTAPAQGLFLEWVEFAPQGAQCEESRARCESLI